jgi:hypothetical protein
LHFRKMQPRITFPVFMQIFVLALLGLVPAKHFLFNINHGMVYKCMCH